jgi:uncharacterized protein YhhL (DUF1145 family)
LETEMSAASSNFEQKSKPITKLNWIILIANLIEIKIKVLPLICLPMSLFQRSDVIERYHITIFGLLHVDS